MSKIQKLHWSNWLAIGIAVASLIVSGYTAKINYDATVMTKENLEVSKNAIKSSDEATKQTLENLGMLRKSFDETKNEMAELPPTIKGFNKSLFTLNATVYEHQKELTGSLENFKLTLKGYNEAISGFEEKVNRISQLTDKQLYLLDEKQKMLETEYSKKSYLMLFVRNIKFTKKENKIKFDFGFANFGNKIAHNISFTCDMPKGVDNLSGEGVIIEGTHLSYGNPTLAVPFSLESRPDGGGEAVTSFPKNLNITFNTSENMKSIDIKYTIYAEDFYDKGNISIDLINQTVNVSQGIWIENIKCENDFGDKCTIQQAATIELKVLK